MYHEHASAFYSTLGFDLIWPGKFEDNEPFIMQHKFSGVVLNLLGPANQRRIFNVLQDKRDILYAGITHFSLTVPSILETEAFLLEHDTEITERNAFGTTKALFIQYPDGNTIEFDENHWSGFYFCFTEGEVDKADLQTSISASMQASRE